MEHQRQNNADTNNQQTDKLNHKKSDNKEKRPRPQRKNQYQYNADLINQNTEIPPLPKKNQILSKLDIKLFKEKQAKNNAKIDEIIQKKKAIRAQKFKFNRKTQGDPDNKYSTFQNQINEVQQLRQKFNQTRAQRKVLKDKLQKSIQQAKANNEKLKQFRQGLKGSRQNHLQRLASLQHRLITATISKDQQKNLTNQIMLLKRKIRQAQSSGNIQFKLEQCQATKERLDQEIYKLKKELQPLNIQYETLKADLDKKNQNITGLKGQLSAEKTQKNEQKERRDKEYQLWKDQKKKRVQKLQAQIQKIKQDSKKIWQDYHDKQDKYWKQKQLIDFIQWQTRQKNRKINEIERQAKKAQYQKRDKERQKQQQLKQFIAEIELINFLIKYLNDIKNTNNNVKVQQKKEIKINAADIKAQISSDSQWKKQKGVEIIMSKKSKVDEQPEKKNKKNKKKNQQTKQQQVFAIPYNVQSMFQSLKILSPTKLQQIDGKINQLKERQLLFERVSRQQSSQEEKKLVAQIKTKKTKSNTKVVKQQADQFPTI